MLTSQLYIFGLLAISLGTSLLQFILYSSAYSTGVESTGLSLLVSLFDAFKQASSRDVLALVALGWTITRNKLPRIRFIMLGAVGGLLFAFEFSSQFTELYENTHSKNLPLALTAILWLGVVALNGLLFVWIIGWLAISIRKCEGVDTSLVEKKRVFMLVRKVLLVTIVVAGLTSLASAIVSIVDLKFSLYKIFFIWDTIFEICYLVVIGAVVVVWLPREDHHVLGYAKHGEEMEDGGNEIGEFDNSFSSQKDYFEEALTTDAAKLDGGDNNNKSSQDAATAVTKIDFTDFD